MLPSAVLPSPTPLRPAQPRKHGCTATGVALAIVWPLPLEMSLKCFYEMLRS